MKNLLTASQLLQQVFAHNVEIQGHTLSYDSENQLIWITSPYGVDSGIVHPTEDSCQKFLNKIYAGETYGLMPE